MIDEDEESLDRKKENWLRKHGALSLELLRVKN